MSARGPHLLGSGGADVTGAVSVDLDPPRRAAAFCAHPDDSEFFVAGTFAKWAAAGTECTYVVLTDGSKGSWRPRDGASLVDVREREQRAAAAAAGVGDVVFCGFEDGFLRSDLETRRSVAEVIRRLRPEVVLTHDPWKPYRLHPDHRECGFAVCDAVVAAREPLVYPDSGLDAHRPALVLLFETDDADHFEDVSTTLTAKLTALRAHESQYESTMGAAGADDVAALAAFDDGIREWAAAQGTPVGLALAESFKRIEP
ncbi:MAG: PIG-L family deacetylase [Acidimicrobiia bacterium]|nr:PIG-L family deacetylase [Acidimicrobiia bacterium]